MRARRMRIRSKMCMAKKKRVFILGSGFSAQLTQGRFCTSQQLIEQLKKDVDDPVLTRNIQEIPQGDSIQSILSRIELDNHITDISKQELKKKISLSFQKQLALEKLYEEPSVVDSAKKLVQNLFRADDIIISFNWDIVLEHLLCLNFESTKLSFDWGKGFNAFWDVEPGEGTATFVNLNKGCKKITILKPHGSFNFMPLIKKDRNKCYYLRPITDINTSFFKGTTSKNISEDVYKSLGRFRDNFELFPGFNQKTTKTITSVDFPVYFLPSYIRSFDMPEFLEIWKLADEAMRSAEEVIVIGYSFPPEDALTWQLLNTGLDRAKTFRVLGSVDDKETGANSLRKRIQRLKYVSDDKETLEYLESKGVTKKTHKKWVTFYKPENNDWTSAYDSLVTDLNANNKK